LPHLFAPHFADSYSRLWRTRNFQERPRLSTEKTKKPLNDSEQNQLIENCIMSIISLHSFKQVYLQPLDHKWKSCFTSAMVEILFQLTSS
jgi:hypothetical protein